MILVSVIIPIYKVEDYLCKCIESVLAQTYENLEIILVDDGSPDGCGAICDEYAIIDNRIRVIHKENGGLSSARNAGLDICTGEYIAFVDSDDYINEDYITKFMDYAKPNTIVCCGYKYISNDRIVVHSSEKIMTVSTRDAIDAIQSKYIQNISGLSKTNPFTNRVWNKFYHRSYFDEIRFPYGKSYEDVYMSFELLLKCKWFVAIPYTTYNYVNRNDSITKSINRKAIIDQIDARLKQENDVNKFPDLLNNAKKINIMFFIMVYIDYIKGKFCLTWNERKFIKSYLKQNTNIVKNDFKYNIKCFLVLYNESALKLFYRFRNIK